MHGHTRDFARMVAILFGPLVVILPIFGLLQICFAVLGW